VRRDFASAISTIVRLRGLKHLTELLVSCPERHVRVSICARGSKAQ